MTTQRLLVLFTVFFCVSVSVIQSKAEGKDYCSQVHQYNTKFKNILYYKLYNQRIIYFGAKDNVSPKKPFYLAIQKADVLIQTFMSDWGCSKSHRNYVILLKTNKKLNSENKGIDEYAGYVLDSQELEPDADGIYAVSGISFLENSKFVTLQFTDHSNQKTIQDVQKLFKSIMKNTLAVKVLKKQEYVSYFCDGDKCIENPKDLKDLIEKMMNSKN